LARVITEPFEGAHFFRASNFITNGGSVSIVTTPVIDGTRCLEMGSSSSIFYPLRYNGSGAFVSVAEIYTGMFFISNRPFSNTANASGSGPLDKHRLISFWQGPTGICTVSIDPATQNLRLMDGAYYYFDATSPFVGNFPLSLLANSTQGQPITADTLYHLQCRVLLNGASSVVQVKLDDILVIDWAGTLSGSAIDRIALQSAGSRFSDSDGTQWFDTLIINDTVAAPCAGGFSDDTWPGIRRIKVQMVAGPGFYSQFTPDPAAQNFENVDELPHDGDTTVNYALSAGLKDSFPASPHALDAAQVTFLAWFQEAIYRKNAGTFKIKLGVRRAGADYMMANGIDAGVSFDVVDHRLCTDPSSLTAWTGSALDNTEIIYQSST
jgi:hypothetical protein